MSRKTSLRIRIENKNVVNWKLKLLYFRITLTSRSKLTNVNEHTPYFVIQKCLHKFLFDGENPKLPDTQLVYRMIEGGIRGKIILLVDAVDDDIGQNVNINHLIVEDRHHFIAT